MTTRQLITLFAFIAFACPPVAAHTLSSNFDCVPFGVDIAGPRSLRPKATVNDEVTSVAEKLPVVKGRDGRTILPEGTNIDRAEIANNWLQVWVTFPASVQEGSLDRGLTYQSGEIMRHFFAEPHQLLGSRFFARVQGQEDYLPLEAFLAEEQGEPGPSQDWYEPNGPGPQPSPDMEKLYSDARAAEEKAAKNIGGQVSPSSSGMPTGALAGRIIFTYGGHGRTWDGAAATPYWRWQRGYYNSMMEDFGTVDAVDAYAAYCFNAGATVVPLRPIGYQNNEVIIDNPAATLLGTWSNSSNPRYYGSGTPYYFSTAAASETHTATYTPNIPQAGYYPVYTWVNYGNDRVAGGQLYKIRTTGGESLIRIDHRRVGCGWIYLGTYYFNAGSNAATGSVVISNQSPVAAGVVIADAIRFGNGLGDVNNGGGISGYSRREESTVYWIQNGWGTGDTTGASLIWNNANTSDDENQSWHAPPRMAAQMYRVHSDTSVTDMRYALYLGWHSNGGGGRGSMGLITGSDTPNQAWWAAKVSDELDAASLEEDAAWEYTWNDRASATFTGGYGEISAYYFDYPLTDDVPKMDATIIEVAYHDSAQDAALMRDPKVRNVHGRACYHATVQYFNNFKTGTLAYLPEPPVRFRAVNDGLGGVTLNWVAGATGGTKGQAATSYRVYQSPDGLGWGGGTAVGTNTLTVNGLTAGQTYYFRVAGVNTGGESFPTDTLAVRVKASGVAKVLIVQAYDRIDRNNNINRGLAGGTVEQLILNRNNSYNYVRQHAAAIANAGLSFDSTENEAVINSDINLNGYECVVWIGGEESSADDTFNATERTKISSFLNAGGKSLFVSGAEIGYELDGTAVDASFYNNYFAADYAADDGGSYQATGVVGTIFAGITMDFSVASTASSQIYDADFPDRLNAFGGSVIAANYSGGGSGGAAVQFSGGAPARKVVNLGFPFECIGSSTTRNSMMSGAIAFFGVTDVATAVSDWKLY
ncbi:MAG: fibronectin type III domain-containing protein [Candidatus Sumerlaeaceae bacterium]